MGVIFQSGEIARHLDFVGHGIRTQLDEIKRKEVDRLRQIIRLQSAMKKGTNDDEDDDDDSLPGTAADDFKGIFRSATLIPCYLSASSHTNGFLE